MKTEQTETMRERIKKLFEITEEDVTAIQAYARRNEIIALAAFKKGQSNPKIKQLEWEDIDMWYFKAKTSLGLWYSITEIKGTYIVHFGGAPISWEKSLESAKSAAQADFEKRIKECLE